MEARRRAPVPYVQIITFTDIATATLSTQTNAIQIGNRPFVWTAIATRTDSSTGYWRILIRDASVMQDFMSARIPVAPFEARVSQVSPVQLPVPWVFQPNATIYVEAYNAGSGTDDLELELFGYLR